MSWWWPFGRKEEEKLSEPIVFFVAALEKEDWRDRTRSWECTALRLPSAEIVEIRMDGNAIAKDDYDRDPDVRELIRWKRDRPPPPDSILIKIRVGQNLISAKAANSSAERVARLGASATLGAALIAAGGGYFTATVTHQTPLGLDAGTNVVDAATATHVDNSSDANAVDSSPSASIVTPPPPPPILGGQYTVPIAVTNIGSPAQIVLPENAVPIHARTVTVEVHGTVRLYAGHDNCPTVDCWGNSPINSQGTIAINGVAVAPVPWRSEGHGSVAFKDFPCDIPPTIVRVGVDGKPSFTFTVTGGWGESVGGNFRPSRFGSSGLTVRYAAK